MIDRNAAACVFVGALAGGLIRYELGAHWKTGTFPWAIFTVNTVGALLLAVTVVLSDRTLRHVRYLRPLVGTGFCGSLTTFSSVVTAIDLLLAHHDAGTAVAYLLSSVAAGVLAATIGFVVVRRLTHDRELPDPAAVS